MNLATFIVEPDATWRWYAWGILIVGVCGVGCLETHRGRRWAGRWRRGLEALLLLLVAAAGLRLAYPCIFDPGRILEPLTERWRCYREPNLLNRTARYGDRNPTIQIPYNRSGVIHTGPFGTELNVEMDARGCLSIHNARMDSAILHEIVRHRVARIGPFRIFLWFDERAPQNRQDEIVQLLEETGCGEIHRVVHTKESGAPTYAAIPVTSNRAPPGP